MIFNLLSNIYYNIKNINTPHFINYNNMSGGMKLDLTPSSNIPVPPPLPRKVSYPMSNRINIPKKSYSMSNQINIPKKSYSINNATQIPSNIATSATSPDAEISHPSFSDGMADELPGLIILCFILLFFMIILIWIMTEDRILMGPIQEKIKKKKKKKTDPKKLTVTTNN
jgi:hypothetical protein